MKVKTYQTGTIQEAVEHIKRDFGPDAMILGTRPVTTRRPWGIRRQRWEVTAGVKEESVPTPVESPADRVAAAVPDSVSISQDPAWASDDPENGGDPEARVARSTDVAGVAMSEFEGPSRLIRNAEARIEEVLEEIDELKRAVRQLSHAFPGVPVGRSRGVYAELVGQGVDPELAEQLIARAGRTKSGAAKSREAVRGLLAKSLAIESPLEFESKQPILSVFVGPTGVGKTTTIAKLAGQASARYGRNVALISTDIQRVAGQEHLSRYGQLLDVPVFGAGIGALKQTIGNLKDYDLLLIDTTGGSPSEVSQLRGLRAALAGMDARVQLVIGATTKAEDIAKIYKRFNKLSPQAVIVTKLDETETKGAIVGELLGYQLPVSFVSEGPHVPGDLMPANAADLARMMLPPRKGRIPRTKKKQ